MGNRIVRPRFDLAEQIAKAVLEELGNPRPPIDVKELASLFGHKICYTHLRGPDGYTLRVQTRRGLYHVIYVATDIKGYSESTVQRMQNWTIAHETSHTLMHWELPWRSTRRFDAIPAELESILEVEAHWCASRLLMPDYAFEEPEDILPEQLADKCQVNFTAAVKRIRNLNTSVLDKLQSMTNAPLKLLNVYKAFTQEG